MKRRALLKGAGALTVLAAGGAVWRAVEQGVFSTGEGPAYEPWKNWRSRMDEGPLALVRAAILAANPHNTQPWLFRVSSSRIDVIADTKRRIGAIDPFLREMYIGIGCALENLLLAAKANGYETELTLLPMGSNPAHAARIDLSPGTPFASELFEAIPRRHTNRGPYDRERPIPVELPEVFRTIGEEGVALFWFSGDDERRRIGDHIVAATEAIIGDDEQSRDSARWYRLTNWREIERTRDGITLDAMGSPAMLRAIAKMLPPQSHQFNDQFWLKATRDVHVATAAAFGFLAVRDADDRSQQIRCGRFWERMHLSATTRGLALHPLNQMPERAARERVLKIEPRFGRVLAEMTGGEWQALMTVRAGYPMTRALASPRRALEDVVLTGARGTR